MSPRQHGIVLTHVESLDQLEDCVRRGGYDTVKVVTKWGLPQGWPRPEKERVLNMVPNVIVRTTAGDPSYGQPGGSRTPGSEAHPDPNRVQEEIAEWYSIKPSIYIELGNEPNVYNPDDDFIWLYRWHLGMAIERCRQVFPQARLIAPGLILERTIQDRPHDPGHFLDIAHDVMDDCDYIGVHIYEHFGFRAAQQPASTNQLREALRIYPAHFGDKPWYITEYGINDSKDVPTAEKGRRYSGLIHFNESTPPLPSNVAGAVYYHLNVNGDFHMQYHIYPDGDAAYRQRIDTAPAGGVLGEPETTPTTPTIPAPLPPMVLGEPDAVPVDALSSSLATMIATLAEREREMTAQRVQANSAADKPFTAADAIELRRIQALRAALEASLSCAKNDSAEAQPLIEVAAHQMTLWSERRGLSQ